ncbi:DUF3578 domain-containing protein [Ponticoccus sp. SC2-23]|uniref:MrcB family domain-containing protein n=1 Tax=Alexandriicola marinus TaxID=2081710 RepID=UPI000FDC4CCC|nr:DUF3578 domain-containing protein [Alexandriicola marinus]MBM1219644.1 DUF3578 domain-containing protein [Ponticoccus sp. SC6-9]MBM1223284.1 DUF3578 domain-containing protein [Ponticoccus sp. SC6-15]MBM1229457.1 DUF3578 domain-containing protein [Ponticoccus sp. SC6-38]MBM1232250.1 DUF3578 domain-containing protein [Ponticoccus sp. SC6-45]MBM1237800.1 DUF3578 domain-containing protein [Ponticoccus sp. SC6-49]MBM1241261.1 DUF3578 domain-containing protein [Ponticoccus sp. SC2-64]MBM1245774
MLSEMLSKVAREYTFQRAKPFADNDFGNFVRHDIAIEAKKRLVFLPYDLKVKASVGSGVWAAIPWLGFFDPIVTSTATKGFYVVYLINPQTQDIYLSMNQGTTAVYQEYGESSGQKVLLRRAKDIADRVPEFASRFETDPIDLSSEASLPKGYEAGHAFGRRYAPGSKELNEFESDFEMMLAAYAELVDRGGVTPSDVMQEEAGSSDVIEVRKFVLSRRIERAPNVRSQVLKSRGITCEGCGLDPKKHLSYKGQPAQSPVDVHHARPINELALGESRRYRIPDDFLVLCPTCHRMIHKQADPSDLSELKSKINFVHSTRSNQSTWEPFK